MILRQGLNFGAHLLAGMLMGMLGVIAAAYAMQQRCPRREGATGSTAPAAGEGAAPPAG
jgi:hypothetical protein